ncbi:HAD-IC family P-type ATPase [Trichococcus sp. K1Tr]|uniref:cation-translocating P-type ATPase n=1 Tax=Trichococcus sp. K1Tr TaxID=3020847 RepID=UPI00232ADA08|nr:HAD-IC family P-type ATPase [Trichococcus sp. K1Tr]MDB6353379.1 HAD-IC family P-type ATPase [Trichococcus sp. K1Tr]
MTNKNEWNEWNEWKGLTETEAAERRVRYGANALPVPRHRLLGLILRQFRGIFNLMLLIAAGVTFFLGEPIDGAFILSFVFLGTALNVYQEHKSNQAADKLKAYLLNTITVVREGIEKEVPTETLVPGDILKLESGDIVPADAIVRVARDLLVDETTFTGESIPVTKRVSASSATAADEERLLQGIVIVRGNALAEVTAIGQETQLAHIASTASTVQAESELVKSVDKISNFIMKVTLLTLGFVVLANILIEGREADVTGLLIFAIALAVSAIPEALPLVLTFSLSRGALEFAKRDVIVKRLSAVQDLGSVNLLCTDKTGTITENHLVFSNVYPMAESPYDPLVLARLAAINLHERIPEPFDRASDEALTQAQRQIVERYSLAQEEAFDPALRSNGAIVKQADGSTLHIRRGSPEYFFGEGLISRAAVADWLQAEEEKGHRVLGVSYDDGTGARFGGFVSFVDRIKDSTIATVAAAKQMNVAITVITGDALKVAEAVGREAGLVTESAEVTEAAAFLALSLAERKKRLSSIRVFARTTPEQKLELIQLLKEQFTVGYLGEGINDAPALKAAHVSMVVQSAADVARETADIVLLQNDLRVIVDGIRFGRETHANTMKYIRATLISNFGNFYAVAIGSLFISFLPMLPKQLLLLNLLSDFPMMAIAFDRVSAQEVEQPQRYDLHSLYIIFVTMGLVSTVFDFICFGLFYRISPAVLQTNWFIASVLTEILLMLSIRSLAPITKAGWPAPSIVILSVIAMALAVGLPMIPATAAFFEFQTPTMAHLGIILGIAFAYLVVTELVKRPLSVFVKKK